MKSDLDQIIEYFEGEKENLEMSIKRSLAEYDYLYAHHQQEGLWRLNNHLGVLKRFKDPFYYKKDEIERWLKWMNSFEDSERFSFYKDVIAQKRSELEKLSEQQNDHYFNDSQVIDDALFDLYEKRIRKFRLRLSAEENFNLDFEISGELLKITHQLSSHHRNLVYSTDIDDDDIASRHPLITLGFEWDTNEKKFVYHYDMNGFKEVLPVKILLSRIAYEKFRFDPVYSDLNASVNIFEK
ncbi:hypothetical protein [Mucilaginibacter endophyticus]|uniref:hypothetical protein n=1 Tax=Mucilaginibacter endophyticus TaxID=2675003 RepID=UPI000E0D6A04|nr:hypothetical protein [Mucilaginibacter endophyticus]